jgi:VCBS repeat-containing protein
MADFTGDSDANTFTGTADADLFNLVQGGDDTADGLGGDDIFVFGGALTADDAVTGGDGLDSVVIQGDYSGGLVLDDSVTGIEILLLLAGSDTSAGDPGTNLYDYNVTIDDANFAAVDALIDAGALLAGEDFTFNGAAETDARLLIYGGRGQDDLTGGGLDDIFFFGTDRYAAGDRVDGGTGTDTLVLRGNYTIDFTQAGYAGALTGTEILTVLSASDETFATGGGTEFDYSITWNDNLLPVGVTFTVDGTTLGEEESLAFNGSDEDNGRFVLNGGGGNDVLTGGLGGDILFGGDRGDTLTGGGGNDIFLYTSVTESNSTERDGIQDFNAGDRIDISAIDANILVAGDQAFTFIGSAAFSGTAGELRFSNISGGNGPIWEVEADTDGNGQSDFEIILVISPADPITASDFIDIVVNAAAVAADDVNSTVESAPVDGDVTANDSDADGDAFVVTAVNGDSETVGQQITLPSGALLTLNADGTYSYDPNGRFNTLISAQQAALTGAVNTSATDTFTYTVTGGDTATVTITINGEEGDGDVLGGSADDDRITGTAAIDQFVLDQGGDDVVDGGDDNDAFFFGDAFTAADRVNGADGTDVVQLRGNYDLTLDAETIVGVERITVFSGSGEGVDTFYDYTLTTNDQNLAAGQTLTVLGSSLLEGEDLVFNGTAEQDGMFYVEGGAGADTLAGGAQKDILIGGDGIDALYGLGGNDRLTGGAGGDLLRGGLGKDVFIYQATTDSTQRSLDTIQDFQQTLDRIDLSQIDADLELDGNQAFSFIGSNAFGGVAGELRTYSADGFSFVEGDVNGDGTGDFLIQVNSFNQPLTAVDFLL